MTHTNRNMGEPPTLDPFTGKPLFDMTETDFQNAHGGASEAAERSMVMLAALIIAAGAIALVLLLGYTVRMQMNGRIDRLQADLRVLNTFTTCDAPRNQGDAQIITVRRGETGLAVRCQLLTHPIPAERKGP